MPAADNTAASLRRQWMRRYHFARWAAVSQLRQPIPEYRCLNSACRTFIAAFRPMGRRDRPSHRPHAE